MILSRTAPHIAVCAALLGGCVAESSTAPSAPIAVGILADAGTQAGADAVQGAQLAVETVNEPTADLHLPWRPAQDCLLSATTCASSSVTAEAIPTPLRVSLMGFSPSEWPAS